MADRILPVSAIPDVLWQDASTLKLSLALAHSYHLTLEANGWLKEALAATALGDIGGNSAEETAQHFTRNFSGSCGRVQLALLDPHDQLGDASNLFIRAFAGGSVGLLDIPCGSGAATVATLSAFAVLREKQVIPRMPLDVYLVAGDSSATARTTAANMIELLRPALERQAIFVHYQFIDWDVLNAASTINLLHSWMEHARDCREYFVLAANFSGFLKHGGNFNKSLPQLEQIFGWAAKRKSGIVWIEPCNSGATHGLWPLFKQKLWRLLTFFKNEPAEPAPEPLSSEAQLQHPIKPLFSHRVNLTLVKLIRNATS